MAKLVPVLLPQDCFKALKIISDSDVRKSAGVHPSNDFAFPNTKLSLSHVTGWDCVDRLCREAKLDKNINATGMRHYIATEYALLDVSQSDRELFYKHMGHSESMNEHIYQCPPAVREIINVGRVLENTDNNKDIEGKISTILRDQIHRKML